MTGAAGDSEANRAERHRWNDDRWTAAWPDREPLTIAATPALFEAADLHSSERVVDIGCGGGRAAIAAARAVGPSGSVLGVDVSEPLLDLARQRAAEARTSQLTFVVADAQTDHLAGAPFDIVISQFGVMFFDEPAAAFANLRAHLRPGGRLAFVCWQEVEHNPWHTGTVLAEFAPPPAAPAPGKSRPGPFSLGDPDRTTALLEGAGFGQVGRRAHRLTLEAPASAVYGPAHLALLGVPPEATGPALAAIDAHLARFAVGPDRYAFPLAFQVFTARNP